MALGHGDMGSIVELPGPTALRVAVSLPNRAWDSGSLFFSFVKEILDLPRDTEVVNLTDSPRGQGCT